jgi:hypothetical protein
VSHDDRERIAGDLNGASGAGDGAEPQAWWRTITACRPRFDPSGSTARRSADIVPFHRNLDSALSDRLTTETDEAPEKTGDTPAAQGCRSSTLIGRSDPRP